MSHNTARFLFLVTMITIALVLAGCQGPSGMTGYQGIKGASGVSGSNGHNGLNSLVNIVSTDTTLCPNGGSVINSGLDTNSDGVLQNCEIQYAAVVCNGVNGTNGTNGSNGLNGSNAPPTALSPVALLAPCAANPMAPTASELANPDLEIFIKLQNGTILDSFSETISGYDTHFGVLSPGTYESTGAGNCVFSVSSTGVISR